MRILFDSRREYIVYKGCVFFDFQNLTVKTVTLSQMLTPNDRPMKSSRFPDKKKAKP